jgi:hypothetical protein
LVFGGLFEPLLTAASYAKMEGFVINTKPSIFLYRTTGIAASQQSQMKQFPLHLISKRILAIGG